MDDVAASARTALEEFNRQWPFILEGRSAPEAGNEQPDVCTLKSLCNAFWRSKRAKLLPGKLSQRSFADYERTIDQLIGFSWQVAGRPIFAALHALLESRRLFSLAENQRLPARKPRGRPAAP